MDENNKKINEIIKSQKNHAIVATALGVQGMILIITGLLIGMLNAYFHFRLEGFTLLSFKIAFVVSGVVDLGIAMYFYRKSKTQAY